MHEIYGEDFGGSGRGEREELALQGRREGALPRASRS
jgi:hypothetical protein